MRAAAAALLGLPDGSPLAFPHRVQAWLDAGWLKPGHVLIDFGAQEFYSSVAEVHREIGAFLSEHGLSGDRVRGILGNGLPQVRTIYEALRINTIRSTSTAPTA